MASILIENAAILTLDRDDRFIERGSILIEGNRVAEVGEAVRARAERVIDARRFLAVPGLVNAHTHTPGALSAGTQDSASHPAFMWLNQADTSGRTPREVYVSAMLNAAQMLLGGITTSIDHFPAQNFGPEDVAAVVEAYRDSGMRTVLGLRVFDDMKRLERDFPNQMGKVRERIGAQEDDLILMAGWGGEPKGQRPEYTMLGACGLLRLQAEEQEILWIEAQVDLLQVVERADEQTRADQQQQ